MDFDKLQNEIEGAVRDAFKELTAKHGAEKICAFALYSDDSAMTVCPSANTRRHLASVAAAERDDCEFEPAEWKYESCGAEKKFDKICGSLAAACEKVEDNPKAFAEFQRGVYEACVAVLEKLKNENFFKATAGGDVLLLFTVSDSDMKKSELKKIAARLNDSGRKDEYLKWLARN